MTRGDSRSGLKGSNMFMVFVLFRSCESHAPLASRADAAPGKRRLVVLESRLVLAKVSQRTPPVKVKLVQVSSAGKALGHAPAYLSPVIDSEHAPVRRVWKRAVYEIEA